MRIHLRMPWSVRRLKRFGIQTFDTTVYFYTASRSFSECRFSSIHRVLFVCFGNICRSSFAEVVAESLQKQYKTDVIFDSYGLSAKNGKKPPENAIRAANEFGLDISKHEAKHISDVKITNKDLIIGMDFKNYMGLRKLFPRNKNLFLLNHFKVPRTSVIDIEDPYGMSYDTFLECYGEIKICVEFLLKKIAENDHI
jgi:protein-tyrosine phosphatase